MAGGVEGGGGGETCAGVDAGAAEEKAANGRAITRPADQRAHGEKLVEREFAVRDVAAGETVVIFEVERRDDAASENFRGQVGRVLRERFHDGVGERVAL